MSVCSISFDGNYFHKIILYSTGCVCCEYKMIYMVIKLMDGYTSILTHIPQMINFKLFIFILYLLILVLDFY